MRSLARESVFKYLFSKLFNLSDEGLFDVLIKQLDDNDKKFAKDLLHFVEDNQEKYLNAISDLSTGFSLDRIFNTDKCAIMIGMAELDFCPDTPSAVAIDEAVNLVAKYSAEKSTYFVNGVLGEYLRNKDV